MAGPEPQDQPDTPPPFGKDDNSTLDPQAVQQQLEKTRETLQAVQAKLTQMRYTPGPDKQPPDVQNMTRADGQWPFLLIRTYPGDVGKRPLTLAGGPWVQDELLLPYKGRNNSPDILLARPGPQDEPRIIDNSDDYAALKARDARDFHVGQSYDVWVHVWNLGQSQVSGVRVRVRLRPEPPVPAGAVLPPPVFLGGTALDLGDRLSERAHRMIKVASFTAPVGSPLSDDYNATLIATVDTLSDPSSGDLSLGADRHTAHRAVIVNSP
jgi:hypothetical protein